MGPLTFEVEVVVTKTDDMEAAPAEVELVCPRHGGGRPHRLRTPIDGRGGAERLRAGRGCAFRCFECRPPPLLRRATAVPHCENNVCLVLLLSARVRGSGGACVATVAVVVWSCQRVAVCDEQRGIR